MAAVIRPLYDGDDDTNTSPKGLWNEISILLKTTITYIIAKTYIFYFKRNQFKSILNIYISLMELTTENRIFCRLIV